MDSLTGKEMRGRGVASVIFSILQFLLPHFSISAAFAPLYFKSSSTLLKNSSGLCCLPSLNSPHLFFSVSSRLTVSSFETAVNVFRCSSVLSLMF